MADARPRQRRGKRLRRALAWVAVLVILGLCALYFLPVLTDSRPGRAAAARALSRVLRGADVRMDVLRIAPLRREVLRLEGLRIAPPDEPDRPVIVLERAQCRWRPWALFGREVHVTSLHADGLRLDVARRRGRWNLMDVLPPLGRRGPLRWEDLRLPLAVRIDDARVTALGLTVQMEDLLEAAIRDVSAGASCNLTRVLDGRLDFRLSAQEAAFQAPRTGLSGSAALDANARIDLDGGMAQLGAAALVGPVRVAADQVGELGPLRAALGFDAQADLVGLNVPSVELDLRVPGVLGGSLRLSVSRGREWELSGRGVLAADLAAAADLVDVTPPAALRSAGAEGRVMVVTELDGRLGAGLMPAVSVHLTNRLIGSGLRGAAQMDLAGGHPLAASASGVSAQLVADVDLLAGPGISCVVASQADGGLEELRMTLGELAEVVCGPAGGRMTVRAALPGAGTADAQGWLSVARSALAWQGMGEISLPVNVRFGVRALDVFDPVAGPVIHGTARGSVAGVIPEWSFAGHVAGYGRGGLAAGCEALLDLETAVGLLGSLDEGLWAGLGELSAAGRCIGGFDLAGRPPGSGAGGIRVQAHGAALLAESGLRRPGVSGGAGEGEASGHLSVGLDGRGRPYSLEGELRARASRVEAALGKDAPQASLSFEEAQLRASCAVSGAALSPTLTAQAAVAGLEGSMPLGQGKGTLAVPPLDCALQARLDVDPLAGDLVLSDAFLRLPGLLETSCASLSLRGFGGEGFEGEVKSLVPDLGRAVEVAAGALPEPGVRLPELGGRLTTVVRFGGRVPLLERVVHALESGQPLPAPQVFPLRAFFERELPLAVDAEFAAEDVTALHELPSGPVVGASGVELRGRSRFERGDVDAEVSVSIPKVDFEPSPVPLEGFKAELALRARDLNEVEAALSGASGLGGAIGADGVLKVSGLSRLRGMPTPAALLQSLDLSLRGRGSIRPEALNAVPGLSAKGTLGLDLSVDLEAGRRARAEARPRLDDLSVRWGDLFSLHGASGTVGFSKVWAIRRDEEAARATLSQGTVARPQVAAGAGLRGAVPEFGTAGDELAASSDGLSVESLSVLGRELVRDMFVELSIAGTAVRVPRLRMRPLGGRLVGAASFVPAEGGRLAQLQGEFTGVDFRGLLPAGLRDFRGDSQLNGDFQLSMLIGGDTGSASPLKDLSARVGVTHVGPLALDRLLLALDPQASNPGVVRLRRALALASPLRGRATLTRGFVGGTVELRGLAGGLISEYSIPRFNVMELFEHRLVTGAMSRAGQALAGLDALDADTIVIAPDGSVSLR